MQQEKHKLRIGTAEVRCGSFYSAYARLSTSFPLEFELPLALSDRSFERTNGKPLSNTVNGIAVEQIEGRSGAHPDTSPSEVPQPWKVKIPQRKN